jgi:hypothetical protein
VESQKQKEVCQMARDFKLGRLQACVSQYPDANYAAETPVSVPDAARLCRNLQYRFGCYDKYVRVWMFTFVSKCGQGLDLHRTAFISLRHDLFIFGNLV